MFFAINVALITYHKLNKGAPDGDAAAFKRRSRRASGSKVGFVLRRRQGVPGRLARDRGLPRGYRRSGVVQNAPARKAGARRRGRPGRAGRRRRSRGNPKKNK